MSRPRILIIGGNGFIGGHLARSFGVEYEVFSVYNKRTENLNSNIRNLSFSELDSFEISIDYVFIVSAFIKTGSISENDRKKMFETNVLLVQKICEKYEYARIVYCSSVSVYNVKEGYIDEFDAVEGLNEYGVSKLWGEKIVSKVKNFAIVRLSSVYGINMAVNTIIPHYIEQALAKGEIIVWGDGTRTQNYIHVSDAISYLKITSGIADNGIFLAVGARNISNLEIATIIANATKSKIKFEGRESSVSFFYDNQFTNKNIDFFPKISVETGIPELIRWIKKKY